MALKSFNLLTIIGFLSATAFAGVAKDPEAAKVQELNIGNLDDPKSLDPQKCNESTCSHIIMQLFEGLVRYNQSGDVVPAAAESWRISSDSKTYTFVLRKNLKWSDASKLTAYDFEYSFKRLVDPKTTSEQSPLLENIINGKEIIEGKKPISSLGVRALDDLTLEIKMTYATPHFLQNLTVPNASPVQKKNAEQKGDTEESFTLAGKLVSNGPFKLTYRKVGDKVTIKRNPHYWNDSEIYLNKVNFFAVIDPLTEYRMYETGQLDTTSVIPLDQYKSVKQKYGKEFRNDPYLSSYFYVFNTQKAPFDNKKLRQALSITIDRDVITKNILPIGYKSLYDMVSIGVKGYTHAKTYWQDWPRSKQLQEAQRLYKEAGYSEKNPLTLHITYNTLEAHRKIATAISSMWKKNLGVNAIPQNEEWKTMLDKRRNGDFEVLRLGNVADINDAISYLSQLRSNDPSNDSHFKNKEYDLVVNGALQEIDPQKRRALLEQAGRIIAEEAPLAPIYSYVNSYLVKPYVIGFKRNVMDKYYLTGVYMKEKSKALN